VEHGKSAFVLVDEGKGGACHVGLHAQALGHPLGEGRLSRTQGTFEKDNRAGFEKPRQVPAAVPGCRGGAQKPGIQRREPLRSRTEI
jgi:hypothetical protein